MSKDKQSNVQMTVHEATYNLLRRLGLTTVFGNPGSTEQPFLKNFPKDFQYVLGLQEASAVAMADGFAQGTQKPVLVNLHSGAGTGNGMCNIMTAFQNKTPLIITAGPQTREMVLGDAYLTNRDETMLPRPWVKWAYQPVRAQDVPGTIMRAYITAVQPSTAASAARMLKNTATEETPSTGRREGSGQSDFRSRLETSWSSRLPSRSIRNPSKSSTSLE